MQGFFTEPVNVAVSFSNSEGTVEFSGKKAYCKSVDIRRDFNENNCIPLDRTSVFMPKNSQVEISMEFVMSAEDFNVIAQSFNAAHVGQKRVDDCTVQELLFAVRKKLNEDTNSRR